MSEICGCLRGVNLVICMCMVDDILIIIMIYDDLLIPMCSQHCLKEVCKIKLDLNPFAFIRNNLCCLRYILDEIVVNMIVLSIPIT